jgi:thiosulfate dehydrogenase
MQRSQVAGLAVVCTLAVGYLVYQLAVSPPAVPPADNIRLARQQDQIRQGEYLAHLGDCVACHTAPNGKAMAGGLAMQTPFGTLYSTNITPDSKNGIGGYTFGQFDRAMRLGVAADGHNLYPAMPYPSFAKISEDDMKALYAYLMYGVEPVAQPNRENQMRWPFSMRAGLKFWKLAFLDTSRFKPDAAKSAAWNRGAYIVQGLGHCGSCHTPRGIGMQERAMGDAGSAGATYLAGANVENWHAVNLRNHWTQQDFAKFLKTGYNGYATAFGNMTEVVHHSSQNFSDSDLAAVGEYLSSLPPNEESAVIRPKTVQAAAEHDLYQTRGGLGYVQFCAVCHQNDGRGMEKLFPPLANNSSVQAADPTSVIHVVLSGWKSAETAAAKRGFFMPGFAALSDAELAEIVTFVRGQWGNQGVAVSADEVRKVRAALALQPAPASKFVVPRYADMLAKPNAAELIYGMRLMTDTKAMLPEYVGDQLNCNSCHINGGTMALASPYVGVAALFPMYNKRAGKVIDFKDRLNGCMRRSMAGKVLDRDSREMNAMIAYMAAMKVEVRPGDKIPGRGIGKIDKSIVPDAENGKKIYKEQCALCHGDKGEGKQRADGSYAFPPLWGKNSFNIGAGIAKTYTAAAFVKNNMPIANTASFPIGQGGLTEQQAVDVAQYFTHMPRPDFPDKRYDWPHGGKPADSRY